MENLMMRKGMNEKEIESFVDSCLKEMTLKEKVDCMSGGMNLLSLATDMFVFHHPYRVPYPNRPVKRFGIPAMAFSDGPRGIDTGNSTCFPVAMARGASFDRKLEERVGEVMGKELRAQNGNCFGGVCINLLRHPAWGRAQETYGEDPYHVGEMGASLTRGVAKHNVMACVKHFAANSIEKSRFKVNVKMSQRTLREVYLPHFRKCIDAGAPVVMGAYNRILGEQCCESKLLLEDILRDEWGFSGFTISDFMMGVHDGVKAVNAGMDIEMPVTMKYGKKLVKAVNKGSIREETINRSVRRILQTIVKYAAAVDPENYPKSMVAGPEHIALALESAEKSMVLLKNTGVLPFDKQTTRKVALIGRLVNSENIGDHASSMVHPPYIKKPLQGLREILPDAQISVFDSKDMDAAKAGARDADAVIILAGSEHYDEGEFLTQIGGTGGGDRASLHLKPEDTSLIDTIAPLNRNIVVVLLGGSAFIIEEWKDKVPAILMAFYYGMEGGKALAETLFGDVNPSAKLPLTIAKDESHYPFFDMTVDEIEYGYYHGYTLLDKNNIEPAYPFGFGLSYTTYAYSNAEVRVEAGTASVSVTVKNTGSRAGEDVVQLYIGFSGSSMERPRKILRGFDKIHLEPGEEKVVTISVNKADLSCYDETTKSWIAEDISYTALIGPSSNEKDLLTVDFKY